VIASSAPACHFADEILDVGLGIGALGVKLGVAADGDGETADLAAVNATSSFAYLKAPVAGSRRLSACRRAARRAVHPEGAIPFEGLLESSRLTPRQER